MKLESRKLEELVPYVRNSRTHSDAQIAQIAGSIREFGFTNPILIDGQNGIIAGHGRLLAARKLGLTEVPTVVLDYLTETQKRALIIADNQLALNAGWDLEQLKLEIMGLDNKDFDLDLLGFEKDFLEGLIDEPMQGLTDPDEVPEIPQNIHNVQRGQIWKLGEHRLMCGDSTSQEDVERLMNGEKADMVFTDPPYIGMVNAEWDKKDLDWSAIFANLLIATSERCNLIITGQTPIIFKWYPYLSEMFNFVQDLVWIKQRAVNLTQTNFARRHENVLWFKRGEKYFDPEASRTETETKRTNKWSASKVVKACKVSRAGGEEVVNGFTAQSVLEFGRVYHQHEEYGGHPTQKPTELIAYLLGSLSMESAKVLDLFLGSGSTLIACEKTKRKCYGSEIDPHYCSIIIERWQKFTGKKAVLCDQK